MIMSFLLSLCNCIFSLHRGQTHHILNIQIRTRDRYTFTVSSCHDLRSSWYCARGCTKEPKLLNIKMCYAKSMHSKSLILWRILVRRVNIELLSDSIVNKWWNHRWTHICPFAKQILYKLKNINDLIFFKHWTWYEDASFQLKNELVTPTSWTKFSDISSQVLLWNDLVSFRLCCMTILFLNFNIMRIDHGVLTWSTTDFFQRVETMMIIEFTFGRTCIFLRRHR